MDAAPSILAERAARRSADLAEDILNSLYAQVVVLDEGGTIVAVNEAWREFVREAGAGASDCVGRKYTDVCRECITRDDAAGADAVAKGIRDMLEGRVQSFAIEYAIVSPPQQQWFRLRMSPLRGALRGIVVAHYDVSNHRHANEALRESEKRFRTLFDQATVGVAQTDVSSGRFVRVNQRLCDIAGRTREEMESLTFASITHPLDVAMGIEATRRLKLGEIREFSQEKRYLRKDRSEVWVNLTVSAMWMPGEPPDHTIAIIQDVTERKLLEQQFQHAQKMEAVGTLAGGIAHDFNNILAAIIGYSELAQMEVKGNLRVSNCLDAVLRASSRAADLVRQILTFSRQQRPERVPMQILSVVEESLKLLRATIPSTIQFEASLAQDAPVVLGDATQIHQVLMNLGTNASHAMKDGPGRLRVNLERCVVDSAQAIREPRLRPGVYARVSVHDTGCGLDPATIRRIFEPFFTTKPPGEGTGLGLSVVHGIMDSHDGAVTVSSRAGEGTLFCIYFPEHAGGMAISESEEGVVPRGNGERILFVDDEEPLVDLGRRTLTALGYVVEAVTEPLVALAMVSADPERFAIVITDQTMPGMNGLVLAGLLRQIRPDLPILMMTGHNLAVTPDRAAAAGILRVLLKPTTILSLGIAVSEALQPAAELIG